MLLGFMSMGRLRLRNQTAPVLRGFIELAVIEQRGERASRGTH
jgi:hypothetical protein